MDNIIIPTEFNVKKISFSTPRVLDNGGKVIYLSYGGKPFMFQTPIMSAPFGRNVWKDDKTGTEKHSIDLSFKGKDANPVMQKFFDMFQEMDQTLVQAAFDNSQAWFKKKYPSLDVVEALYTPTIKFPKDKVTGEITDKYPPTFKINLPFHDGKYNVEVFDKNQNPVDLMSLETKGSKVSAIIKCMGVWIAGGKFGCSFKVMQMRIVPPTTIKGYAFRDMGDSVPDDIEDDTQGNATESHEEKPEAVFEGAEAEAEVTGKGGDDGDDFVESSEDEIEEPEPKPIVKKKVVAAKK